MLLCIINYYLGQEIDLKAIQENPKSEKEPEVFWGSRCQWSEFASWEDQTGP